MTHKIITGVLAVLALLFGGSQFFGAASGPSHYQKESFLQGLTAGARDQTTISNAGVVKIGPTGSNVTQANWSKCTLIAPSFTVAASTTVAMDCAVTGAVSGDFVMAQMATSSLAGNGWSITGASASSTSGYDTLRVENRTGASAIIPASLASSSVKVLNIR